MKIIQYHKGDIKPLYKRCMEQIVYNKPKDIGYKLLTDHKYIVDKTDDIRYESDLVRLNLAIDNPDMVWIDSDVEIINWYTPVDNRPCFFNILASPDICVFYVNGATEFFKNLLMIYERDNKYHRIGWPRRALLDMNRDLWSLIPPDHFIHYSATKYNLTLESL